MNGLCDDCSESIDPLKLIRQGTDQAQRTAGAPNAALVPVDERRPEHAMVFAAAYASYLEYIDAEGNADGDWRDFFASDLSAQLSVAAIEDVATYRSTVKALLRELEDPELPASPTAMIDGLSAVFDCLATLAIRLDGLKEGLPADHALRATLGNLIGSQLSPALQRLIGYYLAGKSLAVINVTAPPPDLLILGGALVSFDTLVTGAGLSADWPAGAGATSWATYVALDPADYTGAYGPAATPVDQVNHLATHNLFTAACETFLGVYARVVDDARAAVEASFTWDGHEPHYALFLAFLQLLEYARAEANSLPRKHLEFYYRDVLRLKERPAQPGRAHILVELAKHVDVHLLAAGTLMKAGKDDRGADARFATDRDLVANKAAVAELKSVYRHPSTEALPLEHGRIFASPVANVGESWHPFAEKVYRDGALTGIAMAPAKVGFAIASHYLWMAEGTRSVTVFMHSGIHSRLSSRIGSRVFSPRRGKVISRDLAVNLLCRLTTEKGWLDKRIDSVHIGSDGLQFTVELDGNDAAITPYDPATHGYGFATTLPILLVELSHSADALWDYPALAGVNIELITLGVSVDGVKSLALSNDHGPLDGSKPFLPYGSGPVAGSALLIGSKEVFQKEPDEVTVHVANMVTPAANGPLPTVSAEYLFEGGWLPEGLTGAAVSASQYVLQDVPQPPTDAPDLTPDAPYTTATRAGFIRLKLNGGFGTATYPLALAKYISGKTTTEPTAPVLPMFGSLTLDYDAEQQIDLTSPSDANGRFFHITPFGHAQQVLAAGASSVPLLPPFLAGSQPAEGELYIGVAGLLPPQNLALLFQVVEGTANPLLAKPDDHIHWTYLRGSEWVPFADDAVADGTEGLLASGIVTLAVPADASSEHTLLPAGMHWVRLAVASDSDAVCRLVSVAAQALSATYVTLGNGATSHTAELPSGTVTKLDTPDAAVKGVQQPFPTFGGRPIETPIAFATRVSERLRHKDRAIALWDYERLILQAFPAVYQARCLNHTRYEPSTSGSGIYRELAAGHVTVVTIPDLTVPDQRDPLRPYTSLRVLGEIERFLTERMSCFARLHVRNPQFEEVRVDLRVRFREGADETFHVNRLKQEMTEFLSPWAFRDDARPSFNGKVHKSVLVNFVEERSYVDYVSDVRLFHRLPGATADGPDLEEVVGSRAVSILVSVPADQHGVHPIPPGETSVPADCGCATAVA